MFYRSRSAGAITERPLRLMNNRLWLYRPLNLWQFYRFYFRITQRPESLSIYRRQTCPPKHPVDLMLERPIPNSRPGP